MMAIEWMKYYIALAKYYIVTFWQADFFEKIKIILGNEILLFIVCAIAIAIWYWFYNLSTRKPTTHGTARWANSDDLEKTDMFCELGERVLMGKFNGRYVGSPYHTYVCGKTRGGKGVGVVIPTLLTYKGSMVVNDLKGENYTITKRIREAKGQDIYKIDPYCEIEIGGETNCINPLDYIKVGKDDAVTEARSLVEIIASCQENSDPFFTTYAKNIIVITILYVCARFKNDDKNINQVRTLLSAPGNAKKEMFVEMSNMPECNGAIRKGANEILELYGESEEKNDTLLSVFATVSVMLSFLDDPRIAHVLSKTDFKLENFRYIPSTLYIIVSPNNLDVSIMLMKIIYKNALSKNMTNKKPVEMETEGLNRMKHSLVFLMDEFAQLKKFEDIKKALPICASHGINITIIGQGKRQLDEFFKDGAGEILTNCACLFLGSADVETAELISKSCGETTVKSYTKDPQGKVSQAWAGRPLITTGEAREAKPEQPILLVPGMRPARLNRVTYYKDKDFRGKYDKYSAG